MDKSQKRLLLELADAYGLQTSYYDVFHNRQKASDSAILCALKALRAPVENEKDLATALHEFYKTYWLQKIEPVSVAWDGVIDALQLRLTQQEALSTIHCRLIQENGAEINWNVDLSALPALGTMTFDGRDYILKAIKITAQLPTGYHQLLIQIHNNPFETLVLSAPKFAFRHHNKAPSFGIFTPIYALHSKRSVGCGDLTDFKNLITWVASQQGSLVSTTPIHATFLDDPCEYSPYSAISRLFWNELYLDITAIPEFNGKSVRNAVRQLNASKTIEYREIMALKRKILEPMSQRFAENKNKNSEFENYLRSHPEAKDYAAFRATGERYKKPWTLWPDRERSGILPADIINDSNYHYHLYAQWQIFQQLSDVVTHAKAASTLLYLDSPLGVHQHGYDTWRFQQDFPSGATAGAPPDAVFTRGQNWGIAPLHPLEIRKSHYSYYIKCLRTIMPHHDLLRLDHVMSLHRLFWVPEGCEPKDGIYVRYPAEEFYAILSIESHRNKVELIGENLGTVPSYVNQMMKKHHLNPMYVLQYEIDSDHNELPHPTKHSVASLNTHDMPPFAAYFQGLDIKQRIKFGLLDKAAEKQELQQRQTRLKKLIAALSTYGLVTTPNKDLTEQILYNSLIFLAASRVEYLLINLEDLWLETTPQNIPTLPQGESLNWQHRVRYALEDFQKNPHISWLFEQIAHARKTKPPAQPKLLEKLSPASPAHQVLHYVSLITSDDLYLFNEGNHFRLYQKLGAHCLTYEGQDGVFFAVWAPNAKEVAVVGDFNGWNRHTHALRPRESSGIWEGFIPGIKAGAVYKYFIHSHQHDYKVEKADPFGFQHEIPPKTASIVCDLNYEWHDDQWMQHRKQSTDQPMSVYEIHLGSWRRVPEENNRFLTYREAAPFLAEYVQMMGYTHVELMPIMEHPFYDSWGYQITGFFAPASRYGTPQDFMYLVDYLHQHNIGVILDWVPSHFPHDQHGLAFFDGTHLFEHADPRLGYHPDWTSAIFNYGRSEVRAFLISSAQFWLDKFHIDGLRVDAVASMLYLDYSRKEGEWLPNIYGGRENLAAIYFLRRFNEEVYKNYPTVQTLAEESTSWGGVSKPTYLGGLGFGFKWDMGWMHDTLQYFAQDPIHRSYHHNEITFRMLYAFTENFMLPLSHDEVVHGKRSLLNKMPGTDWDKFANVRLLLGYMYGQPGKKILFMGNDIGAWDEWDCNKSIDWHLLNYAPHQGVQNWVKKLNHLYRNEPALHGTDCNSAGFEWIDCNDRDHSTISFLRKSTTGSEIILVIFNATPMVYKNYRIGVPFQGKWIEVANSDDLEYGGCGHGNKPFIMAEDHACHNRPYSLVLTLPPLAIIFYKYKNNGL